MLGVEGSDCLFCGIVEGRIPATIVAEQKRAIAFMDIAPATAGHMLVIPRRHADDLLEADPEDLAAVTALARELGSRAVERLGAAGVGFYSFARPAAGQTVYHLHLHVVPRYPGDGVVVPWSSDTAAAEALPGLAERLRDA
jgi:histidine triad (HIT) family protein